MKKKHITIKPVLEIAFSTPKPPEWTIDRNCPNCGDDLYADWMWAGEFDDSITTEEDDYPSWFLVCERCGEHFHDEDGELVINE